jgi:membrane protease YdiL (CAAX protease family)
MSSLYDPDKRDMQRPVEWTEDRRARNEFAELEASFTRASRAASGARGRWVPRRLFSLPPLAEGGPGLDAAPPAQQALDAVGPNMGHLAILFVLTAVLVFGTQFVSLFLIYKLHLLGHHSLRACAVMLAGDARWLVPTEALSYLLVLAAAVPLFRWIWERRFAVGVHWNLGAARRHGVALLLTGLGSGFGIGLLGSLLPMPKDPPIMADMLHSPLGAWLMFAFGVTGAPLFEEMFFRGFLLPAFLNTFRWLVRKGDLSMEAAVWFGIPASAVLTSLPFALLHAQQVSHAWGPVLLIGLVSLVLCAVRLRLNSLAASTLVHSAYNFTLFAGILIQTDAFQHLDRLAR